MVRSGVYMVVGYLCGSILFARIFAAIFKKGDITARSRDGNPGTANAFLYGGFWCGMLTLCGDLLKGMLPVYLYLRGKGLDDCGTGLIFVLIAPVIGHIFPIFNGFHGGKGIAVTFGCLLGLLPDWYPAAILAFMFIFFSLVIRITPHYDRTIWSYRCAAVCMLFLIKNIYMKAAFLIIALVVNTNMKAADKKEEKCQVRILWMH